MDHGLRTSRRHKKASIRRRQVQVQTAQVRDQEMGQRESRQGRDHFHIAAADIARRRAQPVFLSFDVEVSERPVVLIAAIKTAKTSAFPGRAA